MATDVNDVTQNRIWWDERAAFHRTTPLYKKQVERLKAGGLSRLLLEVEALGELHGLEVLHVQCHIGTDALSLSRLGATVTGVDFSQVAIEEARRLSSDLESTADFECLENASLGSAYAERFD